MELSIENFNVELYIKFFNSIYETFNKEPITSINEITKPKVLKSLLYEMYTLIIYVYIYSFLQLYFML